ncbi:MAG: hypothetical protein AB7G75_06300 [Candidatus Binatia bacterium]
MVTTGFIRWFGDITMADVDVVDGTSASLGEMCRDLLPRGIGTPNGPAVTAHGYRYVLQVGGLAPSTATSTTHGRQPRALPKILPHGLFPIIQKRAGRRKLP